MINPSSSYLSEQVFHLGLFGPEALDFLVDSGIFLQFFQSGPFAVQVGTKEARQEKHNLWLNVFVPVKAVRRARQRGSTEHSSSTESGSELLRKMILNPGTVFLFLMGEFPELPGLNG